MTILRTSSENLAVRMLGTPGASGWAAAANYTSFIQLGKIGRRALLIPLVGDIAADGVIEVFEATDAAGAGAQELTGVVATSVTFSNGDDENRVGLIEVKDTDLSEGFDFIGLKVTPAGATYPFAAVALIADLYSFPAVNGTAEGVAFVESSD